MSPKKKTGMIDVGAKPVTARFARASADIHMSSKAFAAFLAGACPKGDVLETARVAGVLAAKATPQIIPMCHPLQLNKVNIGFEIDKKTFMITVTAEVKCLGKTGVEMEALTAASVAALTIYDMMKWAGKDMTITEVKLLEKRGGKSGDFKRS
jgi:cyclic pyranopterin phosphate synthase